MSQTNALDPNLWDVLPNGAPAAVFPRRFAAMSMGEQGVLLIEYAESVETIQTGPYKKIQIYVNKQLAEHLHAYIDSTLTK